MYPLPERLEVSVLEGLFGRCPVLRLKLQQIAQQVNGILIKPRGMKAQWLSSINRVVAFGKLRILANTWPALLCWCTEDLDNNDHTIIVRAVLKMDGRPFTPAILLGTCLAMQAIKYTYVTTLLQHGSLCWKTSFDLLH
jgi:hypothetical protein